MTYELCDKKIQNLNPEPKKFIQLFEIRQLYFCFIGCRIKEKIRAIYVSDEKKTKHFLP